MPHNAAQSDGVDQTRSGRPEAEIDVFTAVGKTFIKPAEMFPGTSSDKGTGACNGGHDGDRSKPTNPERR